MCRSKLCGRHGRGYIKLWARRRARPYEKIKFIAATRRNQHARRPHTGGQAARYPDGDPSLPPRRRTSSVIFIERKRLLEEASRREIRAVSGPATSPCRNQRQRQGWHGSREAATLDDCLVIDRPVSPLLCWCGKWPATRPFPSSRPSLRCRCRKHPSHHRCPRPSPCKW